MGDMPTTGKHRNYGKPIAAAPAKRRHHAWPRGQVAARAPHNSALRIITTHGDDAQRAFEVVGVDGDVGVAEEYLKCRATMARIRQGFGQGITGH